MTRLSNPARVLQVLAEAGTARVDQIEGWTDLNPRQISDAAAVLIRRGYAERAEIGRYAITPAGEQALRAAVPLRGGPNGPNARPRHVAGTFRARLWRALRIARKATLPELLVSAAREADHQPENNARSYLGALKRAGYIADLARRDPGYSATSNGHKKWLLLRDTGPRPPIWRPARRQLHDPNTGATIDLTTGEEVA